MSNDENTRIGGSTPLARTINTNKNADFEIYRTTTAQIQAASEKPKVRFPKVIRFRRIEATICGKTPKYPLYRLACYLAGKRHVRRFKTFQAAQTEAEQKVREIADGSLPPPALTRHAGFSRLRA